MAANYSANVKKLFPPCRVACPAHVNVQGYVSLIQKGKFKEAVELIRKDMPFPAICGRVCLAPCEKACARKNVDQAVAIRSLKRIVADVEREQGRVIGKPIPKRYDKKIAIIGAGPTGLAAAYDLVRLGYPITVFERMQKPGGAMRYRIPDSLLEKFVVENEIAYIQDLGVDIRCDVEFGKDINLDTLWKEGYQAVLISVGKLSEELSLPPEILGKESGVPVTLVDPLTLETRISGVFAGGDATHVKPVGIVGAVSAGKQAAVSIHRYLNGQDLKAGREECEERTWIKNWEEVSKKSQRFITKKGEPKPKVSFEEAIEALERIKRKAMFEAFRCLCCGPCSECLASVGLCEIDKSVINEKLCTGCNICVSICPFKAMGKTEKGIAQVNEEACKGCGVCAAYCPEKAITMEHLTSEQILDRALSKFGGFFMSLEKQRIVCFVCNWTFSDEKLVRSRTRKIADVNVVRVTCIGGLDPFLIFEIMAKGADGILLVGCSPPDCHFVNGSTYAEFTVKVLKRLLVLTGLEQERLELRFISPIEKVEFKSIIEDFVMHLQTIGHSPLAGKKPDLNILENVLAAKSAVTDFRLRAFIAKQIELTRNVNVYRERFSQEEFDALLNEVVRAEFIRQKILLLAKKKPISVKELAQVLNMKPAVVLRHILNMRRKGMIALDGTEGTTPLYKALEVQ